MHTSALQLGASLSTRSFSQAVKLQETVTDRRYLTRSHVSLQFTHKGGEPLRCLPPPGAKLTHLIFSSFNLRTLFVFSAHGCQSLSGPSYSPLQCGRMREEKKKKCAVRFVGRVRASTLIAEACGTIDESSRRQTCLAPFKRCRSAAPLETKLEE